mmetsp:Transcript_12041/g.30509  ORF Transcript_12041/g.30509 Transcript_12041/m.30509 type:complete len:204 (+) Transcript_12041:1512-2123(+)
MADNELVDAAHVTREFVGTRCSHRSDGRVITHIDTSSRLVVADGNQLTHIGSPPGITSLLLQRPLDIERFWICGRLRSRITQISRQIQSLCALHRLVWTYSECLGTSFEQCYSVEGNGTPLFLVLDDNTFDNGNCICFECILNEFLCFVFVERPSRFPQGTQSTTTFQYTKFQNPIRFRFEGFNIDMPLNHKTHRWSLTGSIR